MASVPVGNIKMVAQNQHTEAMTTLFDSGEDSDFTVKCGNRVWWVYFSKKMLPNLYQSNCKTCLNRILFAKHVLQLRPCLKEVKLTPTT